MKKTTVTICVVSLMLFLASGVSAQHSPDVVSLKTNIGEVLQNLGPDDCQASERYCITGLDRNLLIEKRDYLMALLDQYSVTGADEDMILRTGLPTDGQRADADRMYALKLAAADDNARMASPARPGKGGSEADAPGMTVEQSAAWNQLTSAQNSLERAMKDPNTSPETIAAWENRIEILKARLN